MGTNARSMAEGFEKKRKIEEEWKPFYSSKQPLADTTSLPISSSASPPQLFRNLFSNFGDRVKNWITINESLQTAVNGYCTGFYAPGRCEHSSKEPYLVAHHQLLAHAEAVSIYNKKYKDKQGGQIGLVVDCEWSEALSDRIEDIKAAFRYLNPIYYGDYPQNDL